MAGSAAVGRGAGEGGNGERVGGAGDADDGETGNSASVAIAVTEILFAGAGDAGSKLHDSVTMRGQSKIKAFILDDLLLTVSRPPSMTVMPAYCLRNCRLDDYVGQVHSFFSHSQGLARVGLIK